MEEPKEQEEYAEESPRAKSIHAIMRLEEGEDQRRVTEKEKKNLKKQLKNAFAEAAFHEETQDFEDSKAAKLAGIPLKPVGKPKQKKEMDEEEKRIKDEKKKISD